jgi:hypothetical protein
MLSFTLARGSCDPRSSLKLSPARTLDYPRVSLVQSFLRVLKNLCWYGWLNESCMGLVVNIYASVYEAEL